MAWNTLRSRKIDRVFARLIELGREDKRRKKERKSDQGMDIDQGREIEEVISKERQIQRQRIPILSHMLPRAFRGQHFLT